MKFNILKPALAALVLVGTACTANYLDINTNPYEPSEDDMQTDGYIIGSALTSLASTVVSTDVNTAQFTDVLLGGPMGGYYSTTGGFTRTIMNTIRRTTGRTFSCIATGRSRCFTRTCAS